MSIAPAVTALAAVDTHSARPSLFYRVTRIDLWRSVLVLVHLSLFAIPFVEFSWWSVLLFLVVSRIVGLGITVGMHRYFSHHSFKTSRWFQFLLGVASCTSLQNGPIWWVIQHRLHHRHSDTPDDPHSPVIGGFWHGHLGWLLAKDQLKPDYSLVRDLMKYPELVWLNRLWMLPGPMLAGICYLIDGWSGVVFGYCLSVVVVFQVTFAVNSLGHLFGKQRFATGEGSRNNIVLGYLGMGDGWHNNHHRAPSSARHGFAWYEFDMSYTVIKLLARVGLVWSVRVPPPDLLAGRDVRKERVEMEEPAEQRHDPQISRMTQITEPSH